ncbi:helix-turn-helix domain-containing protein [Bradyrhizobium japonicum]|uniref:helix-turn-helix domain-containing protein n=1 Tax=Bradyrhizobium japonicum TaxID=375 RepID=UPI00200E4183|nr:helix-turn-helix domain-containing protein [Bradyrhizobium japonicum]UQD95227.1 hypothetical protein JEY30_26770 [Bradyrhizobium japonicum]
MTIAAHTFTKKFTRISNECRRDERLSFEALGMLCYLRGMPPDWRVMPTELAKRGNCGRERISRILNELIAAGYIKKTLQRDPVTQKWKPADYTVFATRSAPEVADNTAREIIRDAQRLVGEPEKRPVPPLDGENAAAEKPSTVIPPLLTTDPPTTDSTKRTPNIPEADATRASGSESDEVPDWEKPRPPYLQSRKAANLAWFELQQMPFPRFGIGDGFELNDRSERGAVFHWHRLLRSGHGAAEIVDVAERIIRSYAKDRVEHQLPSLGGFLGRFENYAEVDDRDDVAVGETMFDLANHFEQRVRARNAIQVAAR